MTEQPYAPPPMKRMRIRDRAQLLNRMDARGVSQRDLARALKWESHSYLTRIMRGEIQTIQHSVARRIAWALDIKELEQYFEPVPHPTDTHKRPEQEEPHK